MLSGRADVARAAATDWRLSVWRVVLAVQQLVKDTVAQVRSLPTADPAKYAVLVKGLIAQGIQKLAEKAIVVICRREDLTVAKKAVDAIVAEARFPDVTVTVKEEEFLPATRCVAAAASGVSLLRRRGDPGIDAVLTRSSCFVRVRVRVCVYLYLGPSASLSLCPCRPRVCRCCAGVDLQRWRRRADGPARRDQVRQHPGDACGDGHS